MRGSRRLLAAPACAWLVLALAAALAAPGIALARPAGAPGQAPPVRHAPPERPAAPVNDSYEPNDTAAQAAPLPLGVEIESWLSFLGDEDYYKFDLAEIQQITVTLRSLPTDYDVWLYWEDPADHLLYYFGDDWGSQNPETADEQIQVTPPHPGTFYVYVYGWLFDYNPDDSYLLKATAGGGGAGQPPAVTVSVPNGGESWEAGSQHAITWTATDPDTPSQNLTIALDYSTNGGGTWTSIATGQANSGSYNWTLPAVATTQARVRVSASDGTNQASDTSNANFSITQTPGSLPPVVTVNVPNGGESWEAGSQHAITWTATDPDTPSQNLTIALDYSTNGGGTWTSIAAGQANSGSYNWTLPAVATTQARVRVSASDGTNEASDTSNANFSITQAPPPGDNVVSVGTASGASGSQASVPLNLENEDTVKALQTDVTFDPAVVSYVSGSATGRGATMSFSAAVIGGNKVRVVMYYSDQSVLSAGSGPLANLTFQLVGAGGTQTALTPTGTILSDPNSQPLAVTNQAGSIQVTGGGTGQPPSVTVSAPNGGESWEAGSQHAITWTATDPDTPSQNLTIALDYSTNGGGTWTSIAAGQANSGSYNWTIPAVATTQARVRVTASDGANQGSDTSNANFAITQGPPPGDNVVSAGTGSGESGSQVSIPLNLQNESTVKALQTDVTFDPAVVSYVSGSATGRGATMSFSAAVIGGNKVRVVMYYADQTVLSAGSGALANLTFQLVGAGGTQTALTPSATILSDPAGQSLAVTNQAGSIQVTEGTSLPPVVTVSSPNGGESWAAGSQHAITWTATDPDTPSQNLTIALDYSTNSGGTWTSIATGQTNSGSYNWTLPAVATTQARVRVTASDGTNQASDTSNANFAITQGPPPGNNVLSAGTGTGASGSDVTVPLGLQNEDTVKALQTDITFDPAVVSYTSGIATERGAGMSFSASVIGGNKVRVVMYYSDATTLSAGNGAVANLTFHLTGAGGTQSALTPTETILSDPSGQPLSVTSQAGSIQVTSETGNPTVTLNAPNGGESWAGGSQQQITWIASDPDTPSQNLLISLDYSTDSGTTWTVIAANQTNSGSYPWSVPQVATTHARVRVTVSDITHQATDVSDGDFTITTVAPGAIEMHVLALKNPGRPRTLQIFVTSSKRLLTRSITIGTTQIDLVEIDAQKFLYTTTYHAAATDTSVQIQANGSDGVDTGTSSTTVNF